MNEIKRIMIISFIISIGVSFTSMTVYDHTLGEWERQDRAKFLEKCEQSEIKDNLNDGRINQEIQYKNCNIEPSPLGTMSALPGFFAYIYMFNYLNKRRSKTWRSYK
jgi:hypothetical protein